MPQLDALRAVAVLAVLAHHFLESNAVESVIGTSPGLLGVRLFFVLSGFLITGILLRARLAVEQGAATRGTVLKRFYIRRALRIFPLYYLVLLIALVFGDQEVREQLPWLATYTYNFWIAFLGWYPAYFSHFWSLAVEEQFYLLWPAVILWIPRRRLVAFLACVVVSAPVYRAIAWNIPLGDMWFYVPTPSSLDALGMGALLAALTGGDPPSRRWVLSGWAIRLLGVAGWFLVMWSGPYRAVFLETMVSLVFVATVASAAAGVRGPARYLLEWPPLLYLGKISYGIYVYHLFIPTLVGLLAGASGYALAPAGAPHFVLYTVSTIALASVSWYAFERPIGRLKRRFTYPAVSVRGQKEIIG